MLLVLASAGLTGLAVETAVRRGETGPVPALAAGDPPRAAAIATTLVAASPLAILEASLSAHNDAWMMLGVAMSTWLLVRGAPWVAVLVAATTLGIKLSGALPLVLVLGSVVGVALRRRVVLSPRVIAVIVLGLLILAVGLVATKEADLFSRSSILTKQIVEKAVRVRATEAVPRWLLERSGHSDAQHYLGLGFRVLGGVVLLVGVARAHVTGRILPQLAPCLFVFYVFTHALPYPWYLLVVLPVLPFCPLRWWRALVVGLVAYSLVWPVELAFSCGGITSLEFHVQGLVQAVIVLVPPCVMLVLDRRRSESDGVGAAVS